MLRGFPQPPFRDELAQRNRGLLLVDADARGRRGLASLAIRDDLVLPAPGLAPTALSWPRDMTRAPPVSTSNASIQPADTVRQLEGERAVDEHDEDVVRRVELADSSFSTGAASSNRKSEITGTIDVFRMKPASDMLRRVGALERLQRPGGTDRRRAR